MRRTCLLQKRRPLIPDRSCLRSQPGRPSSLCFYIALASLKCDRCGQAVEDSTSDLHELRPAAYLQHTPARTVPLSIHGRHDEVHGSVVRVVIYNNRATRERLLPFDYRAEKRSSANT